MKKSRFSVKTKFKLRQIFGKPGRSIIVVIGLAFGGMLYAFCLSCIDSMDAYVKHTVDQIGTFNYEYFLKTPELGEPEKGNAILGVSYEVKGREDILMLLGIDSPDMINFKDTDGNQLEYKEDHYYITSMAIRLRLQISLRMILRLQFIVQERMRWNCLILILMSLTSFQSWMK